MKKAIKTATLQTLDKKIDSIASTVGALTGTVDTLKGTVGKLTDTVDTLKGTVGKLTGTVDTLKDTVGTLTGTVDSLARSTKEGFDRMDAFHTDMAEFAQKTSLTLFNLDSHARTTNERLDAIEKTLEPLMLVSGAMQREFREHERRILHIERKVGLAK